MSSRFSTAVLLKKYIVFPLFISLCFGLSLYIFLPNADRASKRKVLYILNWANYLPQAVLDQFERETGIHVVYDSFDSLEVLEARLLAARSGYDVVFPAAWPILGPLIEAGAFLSLDHTKLGDFSLFDAALIEKMQTADPGLKYSVPYLWGTAGITYNVDRVRDLLPAAEGESWALLFEPSIVKHLTREGVVWMGESTDVVQACMLYHGLPIDCKSLEDLRFIAYFLAQARPFVTRFDSQAMEDLVKGDVIVAHTYSSYGNMAVDRARRHGTQLRYVIPKEGSFLWIDVMAIPKDARHPDEAHKFIKFLMRPDVMAAVTNALRTANAIPASARGIKPEILHDPGIYPPADVRERLYGDCIPSRAYERHRSRAWIGIQTDMGTQKSGLPLFQRRTEIA